MQSENLEMTALAAWARISEQAASYAFSLLRAIVSHRCETDCANLGGAVVVGQFEKHDVAPARRGTLHQCLGVASAEAAIVRLRARQLVSLDHVAPQRACNVSSAFGGLAIHFEQRATEVVADLFHQIGRD